MDLEELIRETYNNNPFYYRLIKQQQKSIEHIIEERQWNMLPIIDKEMLIGHEDATISPQYIFHLNEDNFIHYHTSGSTGKYLNIYWNIDDYKKSMFSLWLYRKKYYDIHPSDKMCFFFTSIDYGYKESLFYVSENGRTMGVSKSGLIDERKIRKIMEKIEEFDPTWMILQPSIALLLCEYLKNNKNIKIKNLRYIEMTGEILNESVRKEIKEVFQCQIANQYGTNEVNCIAYECPYGPMSIKSTN